MRDQPDRHPQHTRRERIVAGYRLVDNAIFSLEAAVVTAATVLMTLFIFLNIFHQFAYGQLLKARAGADDGRPFVDLLLSDLMPSLTVAIAVLALSYAGVARHPRLRAKPLAARLAVVGLILASVAGFVVLMVAAHPRWSLLAISAGSAIGSALALRSWLADPDSAGPGADRGPVAQLSPAAARAWARHRALRAWATWLLAFAILFAFSANVPDRFSSWAQPYALFLLLWTGFMGASMATSRGRHLKIDAIRKTIPAHLEARYNVLSYLTAAIFSGIFCYLATRYTLSRFRGETAAGEIPDWLKVAAIPVALFFVTLRFMGRSFLALLGHVEQAGGEIVVPSGEGEATREATYSTDEGGDSGRPADGGGGES